MFENLYNHFIKNKDKLLHPCDQIRELIVIQFDFGKSRDDS